MKKLLIFAIALTSMLATSCDEITDSLEDLQDQVEDQLGGGGSTEISGLVKSITTNDGDYSAVITYFYNDDNQVTSLEYAMTYPAELAPGKSEATAAPSRSRTLEMFERQLPSFFTPRSARLTEVASRAASATSEGMQEIYTVTYEYDDDKITVTVSGTENGEEIEDEVAYFDLNSDGYVSETRSSYSYEYNGVVYNNYETQIYNYTSGYLTSIEREYGENDGWSGSDTHEFEWSNGNIATAKYIEVMTNHNQ